MSELNQNFEVFKVMMHFFKEFQRSFKKAFLDENLTAPQGMVVGILIHKGAMRVSDLSKQVSLSNSTVSGIIDRLEKQDIVMRNRSLKDRRVVLIDLTPEFRNKAHQKFKAREEFFAETLHSATDAEMKQILDGIKTLNSVMKRHNNQTEKLEE